MNLSYLICLGFITRSLTWQQQLTLSSLSLSSRWVLGCPGGGRWTDGWGCCRETASSVCPSVPPPQVCSVSWGWGSPTAGRPCDDEWQDSCLFQDQRGDLCIPGADCWQDNVFSHALDGAGGGGGMLKDEAGREHASIKAMVDLSADTLSAANMQANTCGNMPALAKVLPIELLPICPC